MNSSDRAPVSLEELAAGSTGSHRTAEDRVVAVVRGALSSGVFQPGQRLPQSKLANLLNVSRMPVRAALRQLESEGLVMLVPHRGAVVVSLSPDEIQDLYEMRILVETYALRKAVAAITAEAISELEGLAELMDSAPTQQEWFRLRDDFYRTLYAIGNTPRVVTLIMGFRAEVGTQLRADSHGASDTHRPLLDYIKQHDPELAASWLETHLRSVSASLRSRFESQQAGVDA